jgi:predicted NUDIX family NTP pyrophosphohydrolase
MAATSAGVLPFRRVADGVEVLLVHPGGPFWEKKDLGAWSVPKGEVDEGEEPSACALRELEEELGSRLGLGVEDLIELGSIRQKSGKQVHCWAAEADFDPAALRSNTFEVEWPPRSGAKREFPEVDRAEWLVPDEARRKANPAQVELIDRLLAKLTRS